MKWSKKRAIAIFLIAVIAISVILSLTGNQEVHAETVTIDIPYSQQFSGGFQAVYSKDSQKNVTLDVPYNNGKIINKVVLMMDGKEYQQPYSEVVGKTSWTKTVNLIGEEIPLVTDTDGGIDSAEGYYAWYRYAQGDPRAPDWFSNIGGTIYTANDGPAVPTYPGMTEYPGTSSISLGVELTLDGKRLKPFKVVSTGAQWLDEASVDTNPSSFNTTVNLGEPVNGPGTVPDGTPDASTQYIRTSGDINNFTVHYNQTFGESDYTTPLGLPGAAMTIYYAAFNVIIHTNTYKYPDKLVVTYDDVPPPPPPPPTPINGDFDIVQPTIDYRDSFKLVPKPFTIPQGSTYVSHKYRFRVDNIEWYTNDVTSQTAETSFSYSDYPPNLIVGINNISIIIKTSSGDSGYIKEKPLQVNNPNTLNEPPVFDAGWFKENATTRTRNDKKDYLVIGQEYDLSIVFENNADPEKVLPRDPEGDEPITYSWYFGDSASPFIRSLGDIYGNIAHDEVFRSIDVPNDRSLIGNHPVYVTAKDKLGAQSSRTVNIPIIGPEPVADCDGEPEVKTRRPFPPNAFDVSGSWSPIGLPLVEYSWDNYLPFYVNETAAPTYETVTLKVKDSAGNWSAPHSCKVKVLPDAPPIGKLKVPPITVRNSPVYIENQSYSPDGDQIVGVTYRYKYDKDNDGFANDEWVEITGSNFNDGILNVTDIDLRGFYARPLQYVGKYLYDVIPIEDYGKTGLVTEPDEAGRTMDTVNDYPSVSFDIEGKNKQPDFNSTNTYNASQIFGWNLVQTNTNTPIPDKWHWYTENGYLKSRSGRDFGSQSSKMVWDSSRDDGFTVNNNDNGYGLNMLSPWRTIAGNPTGSKYLKDKQGNFIKIQYDDSPYNGWTNWNFMSNQKYVYFFQESILHILDKKKLTTPNDDGYYVKSIGGSNTFTVPSTCKDVWGYYDYDNSDDWVTTREGSPYASNAQTYVTIQKQPVLADETIYMYGSLVKWGGKRYNNYNNQLEGNYYTTTDGISTFDAFTGAYITTIPIPTGYSVHQILDDKDDVVVVYTNASQDLIKMAKYDRNGNLLKEGNPFTGTTLTGLKSELYKAGSYGYVAYAKGEYVNIYSETQHVVSISSDFALRWKSPTTYEEPNTAEQASHTAAGVDPWDSNTTLIPYDVGNLVVVRSFMDRYDGGARRAKANRTDYFRLSDGAKIDGMDSDIGYLPDYTFKWDGQWLQNDQGVYIGNLMYHADGTASGKYQGLSGYVGDGLRLLQERITSPSNSNEDYNYLLFQWGSPTTNPYVHNPFALGQFVSSDTADNTEFNVSLSMKDPTIDSKLAGFSFRMQDPTNRYSVETDGTNLYLAKYIGGTRTVLQSQAYVFNPNTTYNLKMNAAGNQIRVWMNGIPIFDTTDTQFTTGKFGYFTDKAFVSFGSIQLQQLIVGETQWISGYAIWDEALSRAEAVYKNISYSDPENDPAMAFHWSYQHTPKFLNNFGISPLNGNTYGRPEYFSSQSGSDIVATFDKIGVFTISLNARDDPHPLHRSPSNAFDSYRKTSNTVQRKLIVHRKPKAVYSLSTRWDGVVLWNDTSYDPDRFDPNNGTFMASENGLDYGSTRGITERKYYYIAPSGIRVEQKLVRPAEGGNYTVGMQVKDEYGAWSDWVTATTDVLSPIPQNAPPTVLLTHPNGTEASPTLIYTTTPTIQWNQNDTPGTIFQGYYVKIEEKIGIGVYKSIMETGRVGQWTTNNSQSYVVPANILQEGKTYRVQVKADDGELESEWSNLGYMIVNAPPRVTITSPNGTKGNPTIITGDKRPTISFQQADDQYAYFNRFSIQILDEAGNEIYGAWSYWQGTNAAANSFEVDQDLPTNQLFQARMWVSDNAESWSQQSNTVWFKINFPPSITMTNPSGTYDNPTMGNPTPTITWSMGDADPNTVFTKVRLLVRNEDATVAYVDKELFANSSGTTGSYFVTTPLPAGEKVRVTAMVWDDNGAASPWATETWMLTNRPPTADFDWSPKPVWEGDTVHLMDLSSDPDGDVLSYLWEVIAPDGAALSYNKANVTTDFLLAGPYTVKLTVSDGNAASQMTKVITAQPLAIQSDVEHTPEWLANHQRLNHNTTVRPIDFYSGEIFVVYTRSSPAPVTKAEAWIDTVGIDGNELSIHTALVQSSDDNTLFTGEIFDDRLLSLTKGLPNGNQTVYFRITYANGVIKEEEVPVRIIGNAREFVQVHRVK